MAEPVARRRDVRMNFRTTTEERQLIDRAIEATGTDLTEFVVSSAVTEARRVLADRNWFVLDARSLSAWETINSRRAKDLPGLRELMRRPSPFDE